MKQFSTKAVDYFLKFLYGFELEKDDKNLDMDTLKELVVMADVFQVEHLPTAATVNMERFINGKNVFEILEFKKKYHDEKYDHILRFIVHNFDYSELKRDGNLEKYPVIAMKFLDWSWELATLILAN